MGFSAHVAKRPKGTYKYQFEHIISATVVSLGGSTKFIRMTPYFDGKPRDHCGVVGVSLPYKGVPQVINNALVQLQHRGQSSAGISTLGEGGMHTKIVAGEVSNLTKLLKTEANPTRDDAPSLYDNDGLVRQLQSESGLYKKLDSSFGIGHVRYATAGTLGVKDSQPVEVRSGNIRVAVAYNGNVANAMELREVLYKQYGYSCKTKGDTEIIAAFTMIYLREKRDIAYALGAIARVVDGAYSIVVLTSDGDVVAFRDPLGIRPLCMGYNKHDGVMFASETIALESCGFTEKISDILPGEMVTARPVYDRGEEDHGLSSTQAIEVVRRQLVTPTKVTHCMFEWVYFANVASEIDQRLVAQVRYNLGRELGITYGQVFSGYDIVVPIPDSAKPAALGFSEVTGIPYDEAIIKQRYFTKRSFMLSNDVERRDAVRAKLLPIRQKLKGKKVILIEDSIVRGNTLSEIVQMVREAKPERLSAAIACPPISAPCFYGVDMKNNKELIAADLSIEEIGLELGLDILEYQTIPSLLRAIGLGDNICLGCITAKFPTKKAQELAELARRVQTDGRLTEHMPAAVAPSA